MINKKTLLITLMSVPFICFATPKGIKVVSFLKTGLTDGATENYFDTAYPRTLMNIEEKERFTLKNSAYQNNPTDSHIKKSLSQLKVIEPFKPVPLNANQTLIGYAPIGAWQDNAWTGAKEYFKDPELGICEYTKMPFYYMEIEKTVIRHDINKKLSTYSIEGNENQGFLYTVSWYEEYPERERSVTEYRLDCASMIKAESISTKIINLATKIDKNNSL